MLDSLRHSGLSLIVDCDDFNCDTALLEAAYSLPAGAVKVLNTAEHELMNPATAWLPESDGNMLHLGSFASFVGGLEAAARCCRGRAQVRRRRHCLGAYQLRFGRTADPDRRPDHPAAARTGIVPGRVVRAGYDLPAVPAVLNFRIVVERGYACVPCQRKADVDL